ncbi:MAG: wax ester/triacylglycerol synthase domain-containing protein [Vicinamibacteria bacterium]
MAQQPDRLSVDDARILGLESEAIAGHTLKLLILEPGAEPLDIEALRRSVEARLPAGSRGRDRVELGAEPCWVADEDFEIGAHVRSHENTEGIDERGAWAVAAKLMSQRLDHRHALWEFDLIGPLADGREAIVCRIHHAMADGISSVRFLREVLWDEADQAEPRRSSSSAPAPAPPRHARAREAARLPGAIHRELGHRAADTILDRHIGSARELAFSAFPLAQLKAIGASRPGHVTINDVFLAGVAGGLRSWLEHAGERLPRLRAQIPVSLHHRDEGEAELGNRDSFLNVELPVSDPDPLSRLQAINLQTSERKQLGDAQELYDLFHALSRFKHLDHAVQHLAGGPREFSLSISNVPGPGCALSVAGRTVENLFSVAEPADRHALRASAISCSGAVGIGLCTDPDAVPGVAELARAIDESLAELRQATIG